MRDNHIGVFPHLDALAMEAPSLVLLYGWTSDRSRNGKPNRRRQNKRKKKHSQTPKRILPRGCSIHTFLSQSESTGKNPERMNPRNGLQGAEMQSPMEVTPWDDAVFQKAFNQELFQIQKLNLKIPGEGDKEFASELNRKETRFLASQLVASQIEPQGPKLHIRPIFTPEPEEEEPRVLELQQASNKGL
jgi:hypothetical protein